MADAAGARREQETKANVFISYSRKDMAFADRLDAALRARGFEPLIDRTEIYAFEDWWTRIQILIAKADTVIFVLSPDAVASDICAKEVEFAASLNKRFAPIVCRPVDGGAVPPALGRLNFIFFNDDARFDESMDRLGEALETDIEWVRQHTEFGEAARRWAQAGKPGPQGLLLRSPVLEHAEQWIASRPPGGPQPTDTTQAFIAESRRAATRRRNMLSVALAMGLVLALALLGLAYGAFYSAEQQRNDALISQSRFLARDARSMTVSGRATLGALLALSALPKDLSRPDRPFVPEAEYALRDAYANLRERLLLKGYATYAEFSPDGRNILTLHHLRVEIRDARSGANVATLTGHELPFIAKASYAPDGRTVVTAGGDKTVRIWDARTGSELRRMQHDREVMWVAFSRDGRKIVSMTLGGIARIWDSATGAMLREISSPHVGRFAHFSPDGSRLVASAADGLGTAVYDVESGGVVFRLAGHEGYISTAGFSADSALIATAGIDKTAKLWDARTGAEKFTLRGHDNQIMALDFSPDSARLVTASFDGTAVLWDAKTGALIAVLRGHRQALDRASFSPDGKLIVTASRDGTARLWSAENGGLMAVMAHLDAIYNTVFSARFSPDSASIVTTEAQPFVHVWNVKSRSELQSRPPPVEHSYFKFAVSRDGSKLLGSNPSEIYIAELPSGKILRRAKYNGSSGGVVAHSDDGTFAAVGLADGTVRVFDGNTLEPKATLRGNTTPVNALVFSRNEDRLIVGAEEAVVWDTRTWTQVRTLGGHKIMVTSIVVSPDGARIATADGSVNLRLWNAATGEIIAEKQGSNPAFSPDGRRLAYSAGFTGKIWDLGSGQEVVTRASGPQQVFTVAFSPDGRLLLTTSPSEHRAQLWDADSGAEILSFTGHNDNVYAATFAPNPLRAITATSKSFWIWDLPPRCQALIDSARSELRREFTDEERARYFLERETVAEAGWLVGVARRIFAFALPGAQAVCS